MKINQILILLISLTFQAAFGQVNNGLKLADVLQSNMVLQRNKSFKVWGTAVPKALVSIQADWMPNPITVTANNSGDFIGTIEVPEIRRGDYTKHSITVNTPDNKVEITNLLIGDLWFCSGQSNMQFSVKEMDGADTIMANANKPNIRLFNAGLNFSAQPISTIKGNWKECTPLTVKDFSAVGYVFGEELQKQLDIPIGLVFSGIGASGVQAYLPQNVLAADTMLNRVYLKPYLESPKSKEKINAGFSFEKVMRPFLLYNAMIYPLKNLSIKGFAWYQGESNHMERESYTRATEEMIKAWRKDFGQGQLPFYYVQIAPFFHDKEDPSLDEDAFFREAQEKVSELNNTEMVLNIDVSDSKNLHPKNKRLVGIRLAKTALNRVYGKSGVVYQGPHYVYAGFQKGKAIIHFEPKTLGSGLNTNDGEAPKFFAVAGANKVFYPAKAEIIGDKVMLSCDKVKHPVAIRYAFFNYPVTNLQNKEGFPAVPFRTDNWAEQKVEQ
ncbi:sialate O-acetylesterase [Pedobacter sp. UYP30]|uniref:sialate O-acetylesterase n=1 Tax=Pedobacter sp. UYP30 TaxID=1756400 RepID=UPI0033995AF5